MPAVLALLVGLAAMPTTAQPPPTLSYDIEVSLDGSSHRLQARQELRWTNTGTEAMSEIWLRLGLNAYSSIATTLSREQGPPPAQRWGWMQLTGLHQEPDGRDLLPMLSVVADEANPADRLLARLDLPEAVVPGASLSLVLQLEAQLPGLGIGSGYTESGFHQVADWYPRLLQHNGAATAADGSTYASFRVAITVPAGWLTAATGIEVQRSDEAARSRVVYRADRVTDFAWFAAPEQLLTTVETELDPARDAPQQWLEQTQELLGASAAELELPPIYLRLLLPPEQAAGAEALLQTTRLALVWYGLRYGPFPYPQLTVVVPPAGIAMRCRAGHPTLVLCPWPRSAVLPGAFPIADERLALEIGHQYFSGLMAPADQWLADGLSRYSALAFLADLAELRGEPAGSQLQPWVVARLELAGLAWPRTLAAADHNGVQSALTLRTLEGQIGPQRLARALQIFLQRFRFQHPNELDLLATLSLVDDSHLSWFIGLASGGACPPDWAVRAVHNRRLPVAAEAGLRWHDGSWQAAAEPAAPPTPTWLIVIELERSGQVPAPVEVAITYRNGSVERARWQGSSHHERWRFPAYHPVSQVVIDPDGIWAVELNRRNNYWQERADTGSGQQPFWWLRELLSLLRLGVLPWA